MSIIFSGLVLAGGLCIVGLIVAVVVIAIKNNK